MSEAASLPAQDLARYAWQLDVSGFGVEGQRRLRDATVFISRVGGLGGLVAYELAAAGVGRLILAHAGELTVADLNRQLLMTTPWIGRPRIESAVARLRELNPDIAIIGHGENVSEENAERLIGHADVIVDCAPRFAERFAMNRQAVRRGIPLVDCAMYNLEAQITAIKPGTTPCLRCLYPEDPPAWSRRFPVFGAVSGAVGCLGAMEAIKIIAGFGEPLWNTLLTFEFETMTCRRLKLLRNPACSECGALP